MKIKLARKMYRNEFSRVVDVGKDGKVMLGRVWGSRRPSFKDWAWKAFKGVPIDSPKLR